MTLARNFWHYPGQKELTEDVVRDHPRRADESVLAYVERIAILSALMPVGAAAFDANRKLGKPASTGEEV